MRYLVGFVFVLALGLVPLVGCGEGGGEGGTGGNGVACMDNVCPCTEGGIRAAIAEGGGPFTFDCDGPTMVVTEAEIVIDNDVVLDGEGRLTVDGNQDHRVFSVPHGVAAELRGFTVMHGTVVAEDGAGIASSGTLTILGCVISRNVAGDISGDDYMKFGSGGGIRNAGAMAIIDSTVSDNWSSFGGGAGISNAGSGTLTLTNGSVSGNRAGDGAGGGIHNANSATLTITSSTVSKNRAGCEGCDDFGAGIWNTGEMVMIDSSVSDNAGIGIEHTGGTAMLIASTISRNNGGIESAGEMAIIDSTVSDNVVGVSGGRGIRNKDTLTLVNSTVSGNSTDGDGGGIWNDGTLTLRSSTVAKNTATGRGDAVFATGSLTITGTVIDGECAAGYGVIVSWGHNIESPGDTCGFDHGTDLVSVTADDLNLGPLQDNGGPTMTHALGAGSVAIDVIPADMCEVDEDQRGEPRPGGTMCDVGAFEVQP